MGTMLKSLENYYQDEGIHSLDFHCRHSQACNLPTESAAAFIGEDYEDGRFPRLLILSPAPGTASPDKRSRTPQGRRGYCQNVTYAELRGVKNWHWLSTVGLAQILLERFRPSMTWEDARSCFAHVNCVKCSTNNKETRTIATSSFNNCFEYISGEIEILEPDILVTQGQKARQMIKKLISQEIFKISTETENLPVSQYEIIRSKGRKVHWFYYSMLPGGQFAKRMRPCFDNWAQYIRDIF